MLLENGFKISLPKFYQSVCPKNMVPCAKTHFLVIAFFFQSFKSCAIQKQKEKSNHISREQNSISCRRKIYFFSTEIEI